MAIRRSLVVGTTGISEMPTTDNLATATPTLGTTGAIAATQDSLIAQTRNVTSLVTTGGTSTLTALQYSAPILLITGALTSNSLVVMPNTGVMLVANRTTGAFSVTVKTSAGTGIVVTQGLNANVMADGTNVVLVRTDFVSVVGTNPLDYVIAGRWDGVTTANAVMAGIVLPRAIGLPASLTGSRLVATVAATASSAFVFSYVRSGSRTTIGTFTFAAAGTVATISGVAIPSLAIGDILEMTGPATPDTTLANIYTSILGVKL